MYLLKCPEYILFTIYLVRGWIYILAFIGQIILLIKMLRGSEKSLWKPLYALSIGMIALTAVQSLNQKGFVEPVISGLWLEIFIILLLVIALLHWSAKRDMKK